MPTFSITSPKGVPAPNVVLETDGAGGWLLPTTSGKGTGGCLVLHDVWAYVYADPALKTATPQGTAGAKQVNPGDMLVPPTMYCPIVDSNWTVRQVPFARIGASNFLRVWGKFQGAATYSFDDSVFTGVVATPPPFPGVPPVGGAIGVGVPPLGPAAIPPILPAAWSFQFDPVIAFPFEYELAYKAGLLALASQQILLRLDSPPNDPVWALGDPAAGPIYWRLSLVSATIARLVLRVKIASAVLSETWNCGAWDFVTGGVFDPASGNLLRWPIRVSPP